MATKNHGKEPASHRDLAKRSGLSKSTITELSKAESWSDVKVGVVEAFSKACGVNLMTPGREQKRFRKQKRSFLKKGSKPQRRMYLELIKHTVSAKGNGNR